MKSKTLTQIIAQKEYRKKHNYMAIPGDTKMPEYNTDEIDDIESGKLKQWEIAKKYGRSIDGISDKKYRMSGKFKTSGQRKREDHQAYLRFMSRESTIIKTTKIKKTDMKEIEDFLHGNIDISKFLK